MLKTPFADRLLAAYNDEKQLEASGQLAFKGLCRALPQVLPQHADRVEFFADLLQQAQGRQANESP